MKIVIAGSRKYNNYEEAKEFIESCIKDDSPHVIMSGGCRGADKLGERYAEEKGYELRCFAAEWSRLGKAAGPLRNKIMAEEADVVICFWDGKSSGTKSMIELARALGKSVVIKRISIPQ